MPSRLLPASPLPAVLAALALIPTLVLVLSIVLGMTAPDAETLGAAVRWSEANA